MIQHTPFHGATWRTIDMIAPSLPAYFHNQQNNTRISIISNLIHNVVERIREIHTRHDLTYTPHHVTRVVLWTVNPPPPYNDHQQVFFQACNLGVALDLLHIMSESRTGERFGIPGTHHQTRQGGESSHAGAFS